MSTVPAKEAVGRPEGDGSGDSMNRSLALWSGATVVCAQVLLVAHAWGRWTVVGALCALFAVRAGLNLRLYWRAERTVPVRGVHLWLLLLGNLTITTMERSGSCRRSCASTWTTCCRRRWTESEG
jgi:hypothetical protein